MSSVRLSGMRRTRALGGQDALGLSHIQLAGMRVLNLQFVNQASGFGRLEGLRALVGNNHCAPATNRFVEQEQSTDSIPLIFVVEASRPSGRHWRGMRFSLTN